MTHDTLRRILNAEHGTNLALMISTGAMADITTGLWRSFWYVLFYVYLVLVVRGWLRLRRFERDGREVVD